MIRRVGLIGYGYAGRTFHAPLLAADPGLTLVRVASRNADAVRADWPEAAVDADPVAVATADDVDLVVIASPNDSHAPLARAALTAGKHVVVDKPFTLNLTEARGLIALAAARGRLLSVFHNRRWDSDYLSVRAAIEAGLVGRAVHLESHFDRFRPTVRQRWREGAGPGAGVWFDLGPHLVDQALQLFGLPDGVTASLAMQRDGALAADWAHVVLDYGTRRAVLHASMLVAGGSPRFVVHGDRGSVLKRAGDRQEAQLLAGMRPGAAGWGKDDDPLLVHAGDGGVTEQEAHRGDQRGYYAGIAAALRGDGPNPVPPLEALAVMAVIEAAANAAATGRRVGLDLTAAERAGFTSQ
ncbi:oxidoreductase [Sphingomonas sp. KR1UV-12]|uniref:Oxidoreductase n=1 Tax=Sphingomonas aurea TaxID=3063994 RepID=A0ABT9EMD0_9SPHN|nr:oxidoreductase [Sphingomonas sp. KR1UV-12]MDP1027803.1 oxidoreductase [Sphingomonas sp. KR1UV-12]